MSHTLTSTIADVRFKSGVSNTTTLSDATALIYINNGYQYLVNQLIECGEDFLEEQKSWADLGGNSAYYSLPTDFIKMKQLRLAYTTPTSDLDYRVAGEIDVTDIYYPQNEESYNTDSPVFDITNNNIRIYPTPLVDANTGLYMYYLARPSNMTLSNSGDAITGVPDTYNELISTFAARQVCGAYEKWSVYKQLDKEWNEGVKRMRTELKDRNLNRQDRMKNYREMGSRYIKPLDLDNY